MNETRKNFNHSQFLIYKNLLTEEEVSALQSDFQKFKSNQLGDSLSRQKNTRFTFGQLAGSLGEIYKNEKIISVVKDILGEDLALYFNRLMIKDPDAPDSVTPHQDMPYFHGSVNKVTVFVFLSGNHKDDGGMVFVPNSSRFGLLPRGNLNLTQLPKIPYVSPELGPRDVVFSDFFTWHWSWPQKNKMDRPIIQLAYQESSDGSWEDKFMSGPVLVSGQWKTNNFVSAKEAAAVETCNTPDDGISFEISDYQISRGA
jgi:hypothetical protein